MYSGGRIEKPGEIWKPGEKPWEFKFDELWGSPKKVEEPWKSDKINILRESLKDIPDGPKILEQFRDQPELCKLFEDNPGLLPLIVKEPSLLKLLRTPGGDKKLFQELLALRQSKVAKILYAPDLEKQPSIKPKPDAPTAIHELFESFLIRHKAVRGSISKEEVSLEDLTKGVADALQASGFMSHDDTWMYAEMIQKMFDVVPKGKMDRLIDLGSGSSIPTINALGQVPGGSSVKIIAVDIDPSALRVGAFNAEKAGFQNNFIFVRDNMTGFMRHHPLSSGDVLVSNPPYLPCPRDLTDPLFLPVNGGPDGTRYLEQILLNPGSKYVGLRWSSLSNPGKVIKIIEANYDVIYLDAFKTPFGDYTSKISEYLETQRALGLSLYVEGEAGEPNYFYVSAILVRKGSWPVRGSTSSPRTETSSPRTEMSSPRTETPPPVMLPQAQVETPPVDSRVIGMLPSDEGAPAYIEEVGDPPEDSSALLWFLVNETGSSIVSPGGISISIGGGLGLVTPGVVKPLVESPVARPVNFSKVPIAP